MREINICIPASTCILMLFPMVHLFCWNSNITYRKMDSTTNRNCACIQPVVAAYRAELIANPSAPFERASNFGLETTLRFLFIQSFCVLSKPYEIDGS
jgi:hypothetical protein